MTSKLHLFIITILTTTTIFTQTNFTQLRKVSNIGPGDNFGWKVDTDGDYAIASNYHKNATDRGVVYVYYRHEGGYNNWGAVDTLNPATLINNSWFGTSLAISGTTIMVVAKSSSLIPNGNNGMAYIFDMDPNNCNQWIQSGTIISPTGSAGQYLGILNADLDGDVAVLGNFTFPSFQGLAVQIYYRNQGGANNWGQVTTITSSDYDNADGFSWDVNLSGNDLIVGAYLANNPSSRNGAAYIFNRNQGGTNNWGQVQKLVASDGAFDDDFGISVAIDGDIAVVGSQADDNGNGTDAGSAYIYGRNQGGANNWGQIKKIIGSTVSGGNLFGADVTVHNDLILVGGYQINSTYLFQQNFGGTNNWGETQIIQPTPLAGGWYGHDVSITNGALVIGAPYDNSQAGATYFYSSIAVDTPTVCNNDTAINLNTLFAPFSSNNWFGAGVYNDSLLNGTGLTGILPVKALSGVTVCDTITRHINFVAGADARFTTNDFCAGTPHTVTIQGNTGGVFSLNPLPTDGTTINASTGIISNYTNGNSYTIQYLVSSPCPDSTTQIITAVNQIIDTITDTICLGETYNFGSNTYSSAGMYTDTLTSALGCDSIVTLNLAVFTHPILTLTDTICSQKNESIIFGGQSIFVGGTYYDTLNNTAFCDSIVALTIIDYCPNELEIPNFISPNGDGFNDVWFIKGLTNFNTNNVKIFNRYGHLVYKQSNYNNNWSGIANQGTIINKSSQEILPAGTYFYILEIEDKVYTGYIQIRL